MDYEILKSHQTNKLVVFWQFCAVLVQFWADNFFPPNLLISLIKDYEKKKTVINHHNGGFYWFLYSFCAFYCNFAKLATLVVTNCQNKEKPTKTAQKPDKNCTKTGQKTAILVVWQFFRFP